MQRAHVVNNSTSLRELNEMLEEGWKYVSSCPMTSSVSVSVSTAGNSYSALKEKTEFPPTCMVILTDK